MVTTTRNRPRRPAPAWHVKFIAMLPTIVQHARIAFRHRDTDAREEAVQEVVCNACQAVARLAELGKFRTPDIACRFPGISRVVRVHVRRKT